MTPSKPARPLDVGVVGAGYAGATLATLLGRQGHDVTLYERVATPGPVGAGILLQPSGMQVLEQLGLLADVLPRGSIISELNVRREHNRQVLLLRYADLGSQWFAQGIHRGALYEVILAAAQGAAALRCGVNVTRARRVQSAAGGWQVWDERDHVVGQHQLLVLCDGAHSGVHVSPAPRRSAAAYPWGAAWAVLQDPSRVFRGSLEQWVSGTQEMLGFLPTGVGPASTGNRVPLVSLFWSLNAEGVLEWRRAGLGAWRDRVLRLAPQAAPLLDQVASLDQLLFVRYSDVSMSRCDGPGLVYLGDAAHAMSPQLGQGANLALIDAHVLAQCLSLESSTFGVDACLREYSRRRSGQLGYYQWATRFLTPFFQSDHTALGWLRDAVMGQATRVEIARRLMLQSMAGVRTGFSPWAAMDLRMPPAARACYEQWLAGDQKA